LTHQELIQAGFKESPTIGFVLSTHRNYEYKNYGLLVHKTDQDILSVVYDLFQGFTYTLYIDDLEDLNNIKALADINLTVREICGFRDVPYWIFTHKEYHVI
jgi:hypothetical protein